MGYQTLFHDRSGAVATLTLNRPQARNALDLGMRRELVAALEEIEADEAARVLVLTGAGGHFCSGGDVKSMRERRSTAAEGRARVELLNVMVQRLVHFPKPTIAMVDGYAVGAGSNLALCCDLIVASDRAKFGELFVLRGLCTDVCGIGRLASVVGRDRAARLLYTGDVITADEALRIGLVSEVVAHEDLMPTATELAQKIAARPPLAVAKIKEGMRTALDPDWTELGAWVSTSLAALFQTEDHREGVKSFLEKRQPEFVGR